MSGVSKEQIEKAKEWDLLTYLQAYEPQELKRCGPNEYCTVTHDSLKISHGMWCWNSQGVGGKTAQRIVLELKDKVAKSVSAESFSAAPVFAGGGNLEEAMAALQVLGYSQSEAAGVLAGMDPALPSSEMIRQALMLLGKNLLG